MVLAIAGVLKWWVGGTEQRDDGLGGLEELGGGDLGALDRDVGEGAFGGVEEGHDG